MKIPSEIGPPFLVGGEGNLRSFERHEVYEIVVLEGTGVTDDPYRHIAYWVLPDGYLLARFDPRRAGRDA